MSSTLASASVAAYFLRRTPSPSETAATQRPVDFSRYVEPAWFGALLRFFLMPMWSTSCGRLVRVAAQPSPPTRHAVRLLPTLARRATREQRHLRRSCVNAVG